MRILFLACAIAGAVHASDYALEVNFGTCEYRGRLSGDKWTLESNIHETVQLRTLTDLERNWCAVNVKDVDMHASAFVDHRIVEVSVNSETRCTLLLFAKANLRGPGECERITGIAFMYSNGRLVRGSFVQKTMGWDEKSGYLARLRSPSCTGCPECDRIAEEAGHE